MIGSVVPALFAIATGNQMAHGGGGGGSGGGGGGAAAAAAAAAAAITGRQVPHPSGNTPTSTRAMEPVSTLASSHQGVGHVDVAATEFQDFIIKPSSPSTTAALVSARSTT
jgi:hypothetical protein